MKGFEKIIDYMMDENVWITLGEKIIHITIIILLSMILLRLGKAAIHKFFLLRAKGPIRFSDRRELTLAKLLQNILSYIIYFFMIVLILRTINIEVTTLLAGAGVVGLAIGFGAQNLVRDVITGFFILLEDQFAVGDYIRIGQFEGTVEEIGLRTTKIKSWTGELHILPNGTISQVTNFSIHNSVAVVDVSIAYEGDIEKAEQVIQELLEELVGKYEDIVNPPELLGIQNLASSEVILRVVCEVLPMRQAPIARMLRKEIKLRLDEYGIEIPYPRMVLYSRNEDNTSLSQPNS